jgi:antitoxin PrlF
MSNLRAAESTLTDRYQTTVPEAVRRALHLRKRDKLVFSIRPSGEVVLGKAASTVHTDPALEGFLNLLEQDIRQHPERLQTLDAHLVLHLQNLVRDVHIELNAPLVVNDE